MYPTYNNHLKLSKINFSIKQIFGKKKKTRFVRIYILNIYFFFLLKDQNRDKIGSQLKLFKS